MVWIAGFEPAASRFQAGYATKLRYIQIGSGSRTRTYDTGFKAQWLTTCRPPNITTILPVLRRGQMGVQGGSHYYVLVLS